MISMFLLDRISIVMRQCIQVSLKMFILRHTHCSLLFEAGVPIQEVKERLGHSDIQTTMNIYTHVTAKAKEKSAEKFAVYVGF